MSPSKPYLLIISTLPDDGDRSANSPSLIITSVGGQDDKTRPSSLDSCSTHGAEYWASLIRQSYGALYSGGTLDTECLKAPRRRRAGRYDMESRETGSAGHDGVVAPRSHILCFPKGYADLRTLLDRDSAALALGVGGVLYPGNSESNISTGDQIRERYRAPSESDTSPAKSGRTG